VLLSIKCIKVSEQNIYTMDNDNHSQAASNGTGQSHHWEDELQNVSNIEGTSGFPAEGATVGSQIPPNASQENGIGQQAPLRPEDGPPPPPFRGRVTDPDRRTSTMDRQISTLGRRQMVG
jgi:hypothetical protein